MNCEICGQTAPYFNETYDPKMCKSRTIWLCEKHQHLLFLNIGKTVYLMKEEEKDRQPQTVYGIGNTPTFIPHPPITYDVPISDLKKEGSD